jgi:hypothetical protein
MDAGLLLLQIVGIVVGFHVVCFAFGWSVLGLVGGLDDEERFAASWGVGFAFFALSELLAFWAGANQALWNLGALSVALVCVALHIVRKGRAPRPGRVPRALAGLWALGYAHLVCVQTLLPIYVGSYWYGDWWMHYDEALIFRGAHDVYTQWADYNIASRTPLFNLGGAYLMSLVGNEFWAFQLASTLMNCCFASGVYLLLRDLFGPRAARVGFLLAALNLWMLHNAWFTWPKMLTAYFLLLGLHFYLQFLRRRRADPRGAARMLFGSWVCGLFGFLTHPAALVYLGALCLHALVMAWRDRAYRPSWKELTVLAASAVLLVGPWFAWLSMKFGANRLLRSSPVTLMEHGASFDPLSLAKTVLINGYFSLVPIPLLRALTFAPGNFDEVYGGLTALYFSPLTGALTLSLVLFLAVVLARRALGRGRRLRVAGAGPEWGAVWTFALLGAVAAICLHPAKLVIGCAHAAFFPSAIVLTALAWGLLTRVPPRWAVIVCCGMLAEFAAMFWSHVALAGRPFLDAAPGNWNLKTANQLVFLHDLLGAGTPFLIAATAGIQLVLALQLFRCLLRPKEVVPR